MNKVKQPKHEDSFNALALAIFDVNSSLIAAGEALTKPVGQSSARWRLLERISVEQQTVSQIARTIGYARQSVQRVADDVVSEELAEYIPNPKDRRAQLLQLTKNGRETLRSIESEQRKWVARLMTVLDEHELAELTDRLKVVNEQIKTDYEKHLAKNNPNHKYK